MPDELSEYNKRVYALGHGYDADYGREQEIRESKSWLLWEPPDLPPETGDTPLEVSIFKMVREGGYLEPWSGGFEEEVGFEDRFVLSDYYDQRIDWSKGTMERICEDLGLWDNKPFPPDEPVPTDKLQALRAIRDESRTRLEKHSAELGEKIMQPLHRVLIPCVIEAARHEIGFQPLLNRDEEAWVALQRIAQALNQLWEFAIKQGVPFGKIQEQWYDKLARVPSPVAEGAKVAMEAHIAKSDAQEALIDWSRDRILDRARPVFQKWNAARGLLLSALYEWSIADVVKETSSRRGPGRPGLLDDCKVVLKTLDAVVAWLDSDPEPHFRAQNGEQGLANFAADRLNLSVSGARDRVCEIFRQLPKEHSELPAPELSSRTNGQAYIDKKDEIRRLRDEYKEQFCRQING